MKLTNTLVVAALIGTITYTDVVKAVELQSHTHVHAHDHAHHENKKNKKSATVEAKVDKKPITNKQLKNTKEAAKAKKQEQKVTAPAINMVQQ